MYRDIMLLILVLLFIYLFIYFLFIYIFHFLNLFIQACNYYFYMLVSWFLLVHTCLTYDTMYVISNYK